MAARCSKFDEREWCWKVLGLHKGASLEEIKTAYRTQAKKCHPDKNPDDPNAKEKFQDLNKAVKFLTENDSDEEEIFDDITDYFEADDLLYYLLREYVAKKLFQQRSFSWSKSNRNYEKPSTYSCYNHYYANSFDDNSDTSEYSSEELFDDIKEEKELLNVLKEKFRTEGDEWDEELEDEVKKFDSYQEWEQAEKKKRKAKKGRRGKEKLPPKPKPLRKKNQELQDYKRKKESEKIHEELLLKKQDEKERQHRRQQKEEIKRLEIENHKKQSLLEQANQLMEDTIKAKEKRKTLQSEKNKAKQHVLQRQKELERIRNAAEQKKIQAAELNKHKGLADSSRYMMQNTVKSNEKCSSTSHKPCTTIDTESSRMYYRTDKPQYVTNLPEYSIEDTPLKNLNTHFESQSTFLDNQVAFPSVNIWEERKSKQQYLDELTPKNAYDEEEMLTRAIELSKQQASEDEKMQNVIFTELNDECHLPKQAEHISSVSKEYDSNRLQDKMLLPDKEFTAINKINYLSSESVLEGSFDPSEDETHLSFTKQDMACTTDDNRGSRQKNEQGKGNHKISNPSVGDKPSGVLPKSQNNFFKGSSLHRIKVLNSLEIHRDSIDDAPSVSLEESLDNSFSLKETLFNSHENMECTEPFWDDEIETVVNSFSVESSNKGTSSGNLTSEFEDKRIFTLHNEHYNCEEPNMNASAKKISTFADPIRPCTSLDKNCNLNSLKSTFDPDMKLTNHRTLNESVEINDDSGQTAILPNLNECTYEIQHNQNSTVSSCGNFPEITSLHRIDLKHHGFQLDECISDKIVPVISKHVTPLSSNTNILSEPKEYLGPSDDHTNTLEFVTALSEKEMSPTFESFQPSKSEQNHIRSPLSDQIHESNLTESSTIAFPEMFSGITSQRKSEQSELEVIHKPHVTTAETTTQSTTPQTFNQFSFPSKGETRQSGTQLCEPTCFPEASFLAQQPFVPSHKMLPGMIPFIPLDSGLLAPYGLSQIPFSPFPSPLVQQMYSPQFHEIWQLYFKTLNTYYAASLGVSVQDFESLIQNVQGQEVSGISSGSIPSQTSQSLPSHTNVVGNSSSSCTSNKESLSHILTTSASSHSESGSEVNEINSLPHFYTLPNFPLNTHTVTCHETLKDFPQQDILLKKNHPGNSVPTNYLKKKYENEKKDSLTNCISSNCSELLEVHNSRCEPLKDVQKEEDDLLDKKGIIREDKKIIKSCVFEGLENNTLKNVDIRNAHDSSSDQNCFTCISNADVEKCKEMANCVNYGSERSDANYVQNMSKITHSEQLDDKATVSKQYIDNEEYSGWSDNETTYNKRDKYIKEYTGWSDDDDTSDKQDLSNKDSYWSSKVSNSGQKRNIKENNSWADVGVDTSQHNIIKIGNGRVLPEEKLTISSGKHNKTTYNKRENILKNKSSYQQGIHKDAYNREYRKSYFQQNALERNFRSKNCTTQIHKDCETPWSNSKDKARHGISEQYGRADSQNGRQINNCNLKHCKSTNSYFASHNTK